jgi:hypothetical protein
MHICLNESLLYFYGIFCVLMKMEEKEITHVRDANRLRSAYAQVKIHVKMHVLQVSITYMCTV